MTKEEFKKKTQEIYDKRGYAGEEGHIETDRLMAEWLRSLGYEEGINILYNMTDFLVCLRSL